MGKIPEGIRQKLPLEELIRQKDVKIVKENNRYLYCICPFHQDKDPSFIVDKVWQNARCFSSSCKDMGTLNHISFIQYYDHLPYELALDQLYLMAGEERPVDSNHDILKRVAELLHQNVHMDKPREFFKARGIIDDVLAKMLVGYSPSFQQFKELIKDIPPDKAAALELMRPELFNDTITYPVFDAMGRVAGFRNRTFGSSAKYIGNSSQMKLRPARVYGLHMINRSQRNVVLVEGANDMLALRSAGMSNVLALLGSNLDDIDVYLGNHGFDDIVFLADGDTPGWNAALKAPHLIRVAQVPDGMDPDEVVHKYGIVKIIELITNARYPIEIKLESRFEKAPRNMTQKIMLTKQIAREISEGLPAILVAIMQKKISDILEISLEDVEKLFSLVELDSDQLEYKIVYHLSNAGPLSDDIKMAVYPNMFSNYNMKSSMIQLLQGLSLTESIPKAEGLTTGDIEKFVDIYKRRKLRKELNRLSNSTSNLSESIDDLATKAVSRLVDATTGDIEIMDATDLINVGLINIDNRVNNPGYIDISFGASFPTLNTVLQGVRPNAMYVLAASQGTGKSALAFDWALSMACEQQVPVLWISLEMSRGEMADRAMAKLTGVSAAKLSVGSLNAAEVDKIKQDSIRYSQSPFYFVDTGLMTINQIVALTRKLKVTKKIKVVFIDYLQLIEGGSRDQNMYERIGHISRMIKSGICMDKGIGIPVIAIAQLSRLAAKVDTPTAEHIAESYKISQDADVFIAIRRRNIEEVNDNNKLTNQKMGNMFLNIDKNRHGQSKIKIELNFNTENLQIKEVL